MSNVPMLYRHSLFLYTSNIADVVDINRTIPVVYRHPKKLYAEAVWLDGEWTSVHVEVKGIETRFFPIIMQLLRDTGKVELVAHRRDIPSKYANKVRYDKIEFPDYNAMFHVCKNHPFTAGRIKMREVDPATTDRKNIGLVESIDGVVFEEFTEEESKGKTEYELLKMRDNRFASLLLVVYNALYNHDKDYILKWLKEDFYCDEDFKLLS